jgi:hypothetical protein
MAEDDEGANTRQGNRQRADALEVAVGFCPNAMLNRFVVRLERAKFQAG